LAGVATEYLLFGLAEGGIGDVQQVTLLCLVFVFSLGLESNVLLDVSIQLMQYRPSNQLAIKSENWDTDWIEMVGTIAIAS
jgi:hypothetical protein